MPRSHEALLAGYGESPEDAPRTDSFARNRQWSKPGPYVTHLSPAEEAEFQEWARAHPDLVAGELDTPTPDYDVRGRWLAEKRGDPEARLVRSDFDGKLHASDKWKTPYDAVFSRESIYATPDAPRWEGDRLVAKGGTLIADETPHPPEQGTKTAGEKPAPPSGLVPMIGPDGSSALMAPERVHGLMMQGAVPGIVMRSPDGRVGVVRFHDAEAALSSGGTVLQNNGEPYPEGQAPIVVGHNSEGQPIWGSKSGEEILNAPRENPTGRALSAALQVVEQAAKGMFDADPTEAEKGQGLTSPFDFWMRPFERVAEGQAQEGEQAADLAGKGEYARAFAHGLASVLPLIGPWTAEATEEYYRRLGQGDVAGAIGSLGGQAAVAAAMEEAPKAIALGKAGIDAAKSLPARVAELQAPAAKLEEPVAPGELSPRERWEAANRMGVNLDRAQATGASVPGMAKRITEQSLMGKKPFEENNAANIQALHQEAANLASDAHPNAMGREEFGAAAQQALARHRAGLRDESGTRDAAADLLNRMDPRSMTREELGDAAREALDAHRKTLQDQERTIYEGLDERLGERNPSMDAVRQKARAIYDKNKRFYDNHPEALKGGDATVWAWVKDLAGVGREAGGAPVDTWADLQSARSHLLDITRGKEIIGDLATGWAKQLTGAIDDTMTKAEHTPGLTAKDTSEFRQANAIHKRLKELYDEPQSPFYWTQRQEGRAAYDRLANLGPQGLRNFREAMGTVGADKGANNVVGQLQRQSALDLMDPNRNGELEMDGFPKRFAKADKESLDEMFPREHLAALRDVAQSAARETPYETTAPRLKRVIEAPSGEDAAAAMFDANGGLRLKAGDIRQFGEAAPDLVSQLRRQAIERQLDPQGNGTPDLRGFATRWNRAANDPLEELLTPEQMQRMDELASVSRTVNLPSNPSQTAVVLQPAEEAGRLTGGATKLGASAVGAAAGSGFGPVGAAGGALAGAAADSLVRGAMARRLVDPEATASIMEHEAPPPLKGAMRDAVSTPGILTRSTEPASSPVSAAAATAASTGTSQDARDRFAQLTRRRNQAGGAEGVSTPPNEGQVSSVTSAEPNEVHDSAKEAAELQAEEQRGKGSVGAAGVPGGNQPGQGVDVRTGASSSGKLGLTDGAPATPSPQAKLQAPEGATHEVLDKAGQTIGHIVDGEYVPLEEAVGS